MAPGSPGSYIFYQDSADLHSASKKVVFAVTSSNSESEGDGQDGDTPGNSKSIYDYLPWIGLAIGIFYIIFALMPEKK
jgi:hypothetical protein